MNVLDEADRARQVSLSLSFPEVVYVYTCVYLATTVSIFVEGTTDRRTSGWMDGGSGSGTGRERLSSGLVASLMGRALCLSWESWPGLPDGKI